MARTTALTVIITLVAGIFIGRYLIPAGIPGEIAPLQFLAVEEGKRQLVFPTFWEAWDMLHENFIGALNDKNLFYGAVEGMINAAGDPYTAFANPEDTKQLEETLAGEFSGVGIEIGVRGGAVKVIAPLAGSPAEKAGILAGDTIIAVDGENVTSKTTLDDIVRKIRGPLGTKVTLKVVHENEQETKEIAIERATIVIKSVKTEMKDDLAHITITSFDDDTAKEFTAAARAALHQGAKGILLDLRNNPGGFLEAAVKVTSEFLPKGELVVTERGKNDTVREHRAEGHPNLQELPVIVIVNSGSASASEIVAGALADQRNSPIIGTATFGKGSVQDFKKFKDGSSIRVTIAKWFTPKGRSIEEEGIAPTITVEDNTETEADEQLDRAIQELLSQRK